MTISSRRPLPCVVALGLSLSLLGGTVGQARAQSASDLATARAFYKEAREARDKGDTKGALEKFKAANALAGTPITALELGRTYALVGQPVEALETWLSVARMKVDAKESDNAKSARTEAATLAEQIGPKVPALVVKIDGLPAGVTPTVTVDGAALPVETLGLPRKLNPGEHTVVARADGVAEETRTATLKEGATETVAITFVRGSTAPVVPPVVPPPRVEKPAPSPVAPSETTRTKTNPLVYVGFGVGAVGVALGAVGGVVAFSEKSKLTPLCEGLVCETSARKIVSSGRTWATVSTIGFIVGGVGVAAGVVGLLTPSKEIVLAPGVKARLTLDPGSVGLEGTF